MTDMIKEAAIFLRSAFELNPGESIGSSHAHAAIAGYCGYNSKKALIDDGLDIEDENLLLHIEQSEDKLEQAIERMGPTPLKRIPIDLLADAIHTALTPACEHCGKKVRDSFPVYEAPEEEPVAWVCDYCLRDFDEDYDTCKFWGCDKLYRSEYINHNGECPEHDGESDMDEAERDGWESIIERALDDW